RLRFKATLSDQTANGLFRTPLLVTYRMLEGAEREKALHPPPPPKTEPKPMSDAELNTALTDLKAADNGRRQGAADRLGKAVPDRRRVEVGGALEKLLTDGDLFTRTAGARALGTWGTKNNVPALLKVLNDKEAFPRGAAIEALGQIRDPRAVEPVAARL